VYFNIIYYLMLSCLLVCNSVMEVFHDAVFDLLPAYQDSPGLPFTRTVLKVRDHPKKAVHVQGDTTVCTPSLLFYDKIRKKRNGSARRNCKQI